MKIPSSLGNASVWRKVTVGLAFILIILLMGFFTPKRNRDSRIIYHQSQWNEYAPEIDRALETEQKAEPLRLSHVYGGVVSHHIPTTIERLVEFYSRLKQRQSVKNFIVIGPDHTDAGSAPITVSNANFYTVYGEVKPINGLALKLESMRLANIEEAPYDPEHSVGSQILLISKIFPGANVTPIILRSDTTKDEAQALGKMLASFLDDETVLIASVDFSHYLSTDQAMPIDQISGEVVRDLDLDALSLVKADSSKSMAVFMEAMNQKKATGTDSFAVLNTNDFIQDSDYTTGYIFGYWGKD